LMAGIAWIIGMVYVRYRRRPGEAVVYR
jgi:hypothetical protein